MLPFRIADEMTSIGSYYFNNAIYDMKFT